MSSRLFSTGFQNRKDVRFQSQLQERQLANQIGTSHTVRNGAPWEGVTPDVPHESEDLRYVRSSSNLVAKPDPAGSGEVLMNDVGFKQLDGPTPTLPLGDDVNSTQVVVLVQQFPLVDAITGGTEPGTPTGEEDTQAIALTAGNGTNAGSFEMYRITPSTANWDEVAYTVTALTPAPKGNRDGDSITAESIKSMPDACVFHKGAPNRIDGSGPITQPAFIWTNNSDPVMIYPATNNTLTFEPITNTLGADGGGEANNQDFRCISVETFGDRVYFFNTFEYNSVIAAGVRHQNRLRRSPRGTADPDTARLGSGFIDMETFSGAGLRVESLGDVLACYFQDGVAFVRETGLASAPNAVQVLDVKRGLLGTHAMTSISDNAHFGIFDDGWWFLDSSGRWREAGVVSFNGKPVKKWHRTFYSLLDPLNFHRIHTFYDRERNWVRIVVPIPDSETTQTWIYDIEADRVWTLDYPTSLSNGGGVTLWSEIVQRTTAAETWETIAGTWADIDPTITWASLTSEKGNKRLVHANHTGYVYYHTENLINFGDATPTWSYEVIASDLGRPRTLKTADRLGIEHVNSSNTASLTVTVKNAKSNEQTLSVGLNKTTAGDVEMSDAYFRNTGEHVAYKINGSGPIRVRSFDLDIIEEGTERRY